MPFTYSQFSLQGILQFGKRVMKVDQGLKMLINKIHKMLLLNFFEFCLIIEKIIISSIYFIDKAVE